MLANIVKEIKLKVLMSLMSPLLLVLSVELRASHVLGSTQPLRHSLSPVHSIENTESTEWFF